MPLYEYECVKCGHRFEKIESVSASTTKKCPKCGGRAERQLAAPAIQFKGSGWYVTDYAKSPASAAKESATGDGAGESEKPAEKSGDAKTESKPAPARKTDKVSDRKKK